MRKLLSSIVLSGAAAATTTACLSLSTFGNSPSSVFTEDIDIGENNFLRVRVSRYERGEALYVESLNPHQNNERVFSFVAEDLDGDYRFERVIKGIEDWEISDIYSPRDKDVSRFTNNYKLNELLEKAIKQRKERIELEEKWKECIEKHGWNCFYFPFPFPFFPMMPES